MELQLFRHLSLDPTTCKMTSDVAPPRKILCIGIADSQLKWLAAVSRPFVERGYKFDLVAPSKSSIQLTVHALDAAGIEVDPLRMSAAEVADTDLCFEYAVIIVIDTGSELFRFFHRFEKACRRNPNRPRPVIITGYIGMVLEKYTEGLLWRTGADYILINSSRDLERARRLFEELDLEPEPLFESGLVLLDGIKKRQDAPVWPPRKLVFAAQPHFPGSRRERLYILERLSEYAERFPDREVIVKLRTRPGVGSFHTEKYHYEELYEAGKERLSPRLSFGYGSMAEYLEQADLLVTVSSTAVLEACAAGVPGAIISDFGIKESIGTEVFQGSGMLASFDELLADRRPEADEAWLRENGVDEFVHERLERLADACESALLQQQHKKRPMRLRRPYYIRSEAGAYYRRLNRIG